MNLRILFFAFLIYAHGCSNDSQGNKYPTSGENSVESKNQAKGTFGYDQDFLQKHYPNTVVLRDPSQGSGIIVTPELQGRVMTSALDGDESMSLGWINHDLIASKEIDPQFNAFGGEERLWLGPEGGQFALFFEKGAGFDFEHWKVPTVIDTEPFEVISQHASSIVLKKQTSLINYSGTEFSMDITREVRLLSQDDIMDGLGLEVFDLKSVAYQTQNTVLNTGANAWSEKSGTISIWLLSMFNSSPSVTVVAPIKRGSETELGKPVNDNYFGQIANDRLKASEDAIFFKADGKSRGKIGISPKRATKFIGSYDAENGVLTVLEIGQPNPMDKYVNSSWEIQKDPFSGDVLNSYNDGPLENGDQLGPFYELESSSPALMLQPNESHTHLQRIYHFMGSDRSLDKISKKILGIALEEIANVFTS